MDFINQDIILFFDPRQTLLPLYEAFAGKMAERFPDTKTKVQKTHIVISEMPDLDEELFAWVEQAYMFSGKK